MRTQENWISLLLWHEKLTCIGTSLAEASLLQQLFSLHEGSLYERYR